MNPSRAWQDFERDFLGANTWPQRKEGFPADLLEALSPAERERAASILLERLDRGDDWPVLGLAFLGAKSAVPALERLLHAEPYPGMQASLARALFELTGNASLERYPAAVARDQGVFWSGRIDAIYHLARFATGSARAVLEGLRGDPEYLVAYNAGQALKAMRRP